MNTNAGSINQSARGSIILTIAGLVLSSIACGGVASTAPPAAANSPIPSASAELPTPFPTIPLSTETAIATLTPSVSTDAPASLPTSTWKAGWVDFVNGYYGYAISLPPSAEVSKGGIVSMPADESLWLTFDELNRTYPPGGCISINYQSVSINIKVADSVGGKYMGQCSRTGIGAVYPVWTKEEISVGEAAFSASHAIIYESNAPGAKSLEEYYYVNIGDGGLIYFEGAWSDQIAYEQYLNDKAVTLEILRSYRSVQKTELYCPEPAPTRLKSGGFAYRSTDPPLTHNNARSAPGINQELIGKIEPGKTIELLEGPVCNNSLQWWKVRVLATGLVGWTPEGDRNSYWLIPCESKENCGRP